MHLNKTAWYFLPALHCVHLALNNDKKNSPGQVFFAVILCFQRAMQIKKEWFLLSSGFSFRPRSCLPQARLRS